MDASCFGLKIRRAFPIWPLRGPNFAWFLLWWPNVWWTVQIMKLLIM